MGHLLLSDFKNCEEQKLKYVLLFLSFLKHTAINAAKNGDCILATLKKTINGKERLLVIMGERHIKNQADSELGKNLLNAFTQRGLEEIDISNYWFSSSLGEALTHKSQGDRKLNSSILDAMGPEIAKSLEGPLLAALAERIGTGEMSMEDALERLTKEDFQKNYKADRPSGEQALMVEIALNYLDFESLRKQLPLLVEASSINDSGHSIQETKKQIVNYQLEKGHKPTLLEKAGGVGYVIGNKVSIYMCASLVCAAVAGFFVPPEYANSYFIVP